MRAQSCIRCMLPMSRNFCHTLSLSTAECLPEIAVLVFFHSLWWSKENHHQQRVCGRQGVLLKSLTSEMWYVCSHHNPDIWLHFWEGKATSCTLWGCVIYIPSIYLFIYIMSFSCWLVGFSLCHMTPSKRQFASWAGSQSITEASQLLCIHNTV